MVPPGKLNNPAGGAGQPPVGSGGMPGVPSSAQAPHGSLVGGAGRGGPRPPVAFGAGAARPSPAFGGPMGIMPGGPFARAAGAAPAGGQAHGSPSMTGVAGGGVPPARLGLAAQAQAAQPPQQHQVMGRMGANPARAPPPLIGGGGLGGMRELRVEDALFYLDDVKRAFDDRPEVYNEFLSIMKNFKSQEVDTPGVIARVSKLFHGYNNLILGFNKFLPDGYKISVEDLERMNRANQAQAQAAAVAAQAQAAQAQAAQAHLQQRQQQQQQQRQAVQHPSPQTQQKPPSAKAQTLMPQQQLAEPRPPLLHQQQDGPVGVPQQLQRQPLGQQRGMAAGTGRGRGRGGRGRLPTHNNNNRVPPVVQETQRPPQGQVTPGGSASAAKSPPPQEATQRAPQPAAQAQQPPPVEFDHAISYVTTIKRRFADDPKTYHSFLEILHTYQKEQRGIKQVLEEVARLFADHPDLLKEFTFFLPDAVQEQAKERLHRAAAESEARQAAERAKQLGQQQGKAGKGQVGGAPNDPKYIMDLSEGQPQDDREPLNRGTKRPYGAPLKGLPAVAPLAVPQPEAAVYNSAVERQFFDSAREALTSFARDGGQAWAEFLKCLDLYAQEILSRTEMMHIVEPLLGKRNAKLFEEFKRILAASGSQTGQPPSLEDAWYSVPLSEIDFSRCRRCSPSYRALPRDYPAPPCSDRSEVEKKVLNDVWVSLPVGSEESYTFRHMRRNTYEEILFRCEDERFEIDMVIDSNAATLRRLEPIAKEIAQLSREEPLTQDLHSKPSGRVGLGGRRFRYSFDKNILGVIHRNSIDRIYGDAGQEMLELMVKNPTVAVPVVVKRLRQKNNEWLVVRERLNHHWKELAKVNYYRSLDHRSLTWRTTDKRATSTRTLVTEIKDRAANGGKEGDAAIQAKLEKAKEEHGTFYEVTMGEALSRQLDLTNLPKPDRRIFTPHLSLLFENNTWAQRDAYRIVSFALERGSISPADKERCHRLWIDFLGPWFGLTLNWMQKPAIAVQEGPTTSSDATVPKAIAHEQMPMEMEADEDSMEEDAEAHLSGTVVMEELRNERPPPANSSAILDHHPLPAGARVSTIFGQGKVSSFRRAENTYVVDLPFGAKAYLQPSAVLCSVMAVEKSDYTSQLRAEDRTRMERSMDMLAIGTQSLYLFLRLHHILIRRLNIAKQAAYSVADDMTLCTLVEQMTGDDKETLGRRRYEAFLSLVYALLDGGASMSSGGVSEGGKYEDRVRCLLGHEAYELATMDKLISHLLKNLQAMGNDETMWNLIELFRRHADEGVIKPESFRQEAAYLSEGEQVFAFQYSPLQKEDNAVLHFEYLGVISEEEVAHVEDSQPAKRQKR